MKKKLVEVFYRFHECEQIGKYFDYDDKFCYDGYDKFYCVPKWAIRRIQRKIKDPNGEAFNHEDKIYGCKYAIVIVRRQWKKHRKPKATAYSYVFEI